MADEFEAVCGPKFMTFWNNVEAPCCCQRTCLYRILFRKYRPLKLPLSCEVVQTGGFLGPRFAGGRGISQISDMRFQITLTSDHVANFR